MRKFAHIIELTRVPLVPAVDPESEQAEPTAPAAAPAQPVPAPKPDLACVSP